MRTLFDPLQIGDLTLPNRIIMAPLTRKRAGDERVPNALMAKYYAERASAGLILTEATSVTPQGVGYAATPGIWSQKQVSGWKLVTEAVHAAGGKIFLQLWHVGRMSDPIFLNGDLPVAPSAIAPQVNVSLVRPQRPYVTPRAQKVTEIPGLVDAYRTATFVYVARERSGQKAGQYAGGILPSANVPTSAFSASRCNKSGVAVSSATLPLLAQSLVCCIHRLNPPSRPAVQGPASVRCGR